MFHEPAFFFAKIREEKVRLLRQIIGVAYLQATNLHRGTCSTHVRRIFGKTEQNSDRMEEPHS
jgi:hypothetical protein